MRKLRAIRIDPGDAAVDQCRYANGAIGLHGKRVQAFQARIDPSQ